MADTEGADAAVVLGGAVVVLDAEGTMEVAREDNLTLSLESSP